MSASGTVRLIGHHVPATAPHPVADREAPEDPTVTEQVRYAAPEQLLANTRIGPPVDVWAAALVASELVAGEHPIPRALTELFDVMSATLHGPQPSAQFPASIREVLLRALAREAQARPTAAALRAELIAAAAAARIRITPDVIVKKLIELGVFGVLAEQERIASMAPSSMRDSLEASLQRITSGSYEYFDWNGTAVRVRSGSPPQSFRGGEWRDGGPSYTVRQEECDALSRDELEARFPDAASS